MWKSVVRVRVRHLKTKEGEFWMVVCLRESEASWSISKIVNQIEPSKL